MISLLAQPEPHCEAGAKAKAASSALAPSSYACTPATQMERAQIAMTGLGKSKGCCMPSSRHTIPAVSKGEQTPKVQSQGLRYLTRASEGTGSAGPSSSGTGDGIYESGERGQHRMVGDLKVRGSARSTPLLAPGTQWACLPCLRSSTSQIHKVLLRKDAPVASIQYM